jgi:hypothetical protein
MSPDSCLQTQPRHPLTRVSPLPHVRRGLPKSRAAVGFQATGVGPMPRDCHSVSPDETVGLAAALSQMEGGGQDQSLKRDGEDG